MAFGQGTFLRMKSILQFVLEALLSDMFSCHVKYELNNPL